MDKSKIIGIISGLMQTLAAALKDREYFVSKDYIDTNSGDIEIDIKDRIIDHCDMIIDGLKDGIRELFNDL